MPHSLTKIWIHGIWGTKDRVPLISSDIENDLYTHIKNHLIKDYNCLTKIINGTSDHIHILFLLNQNHSVQEIFKNIKGESSHWINQNKLSKQTFSWQTGYAAFSVSESTVRDVEKYIANQKEHHKKVSYFDEVELFLKKYQLSNLNR